MSKKIITVVGITGKQGSSVANHFLKEATWQVRGISRDPNSDKAKAWTAKGVEVVQADLDNIDSLVHAFKGSNAIFAVTDYTVNIQRASRDENIKKQGAQLGKSIEVYAGDLEQIQGINAAKAASHPDVLATLERYIWSTLPHVSKMSSGKYTKVYEFDSKANVEQYIRQSLPQLAQRLSTVMMGNYLENWPYISALAPQREKDGSFSFLFPDIPGKHVAHPELWVTQDAGIFVKALILDHPIGTEVLAATAIIAYEDYAKVWGKVMGLQTQFKLVSEDEYAALVPEEIRVTVMEMLKFITEYWVPPQVKTAVELGIKSTPLEDFIKSQSWNL